MNFALPRRPLECNNRFAADALDFTAAKTFVLVLFDAIQIGGNNLKLQAGTSGVQYKDVHKGDLVLEYGIKTRSRARRL